MANERPILHASLLQRLAESRRTLGLLVVALAFLAYGNTLMHEFAFDDLLTVERNPLMRSDQYWRHFFSDDYFPMSGESTFRPVVTLSYGLENHLFGPNPAVYHATNLALHMLNAWLVFLIGAGWWAGPVWGAVAGGLFAIHTAGTEAVNGISFREDLLVSTLLLLAWLFLRKGIGGARPKRLPLIGASAFCLLACLSKESALVFPALVIIGARCGLLSIPAGGRLPLRRTLIALNVLLPGVLLFLWIWGWWMANPVGKPNLYLGGSRLTALFNVPEVYGHQLRRLALPYGLMADYSFEPLTDVSSLRARLGMGVFIVALCAVCFLCERAPRIGFGLAWALITLLPVSNIVPLFNPVADRYLYLPLVGWTLSLAAVAEALWRRAPAWGPSAELVVRRGLGWCALLTVLGLLYATTNRNLVWGSDERLWLETAERNPASWRAWFRLGFRYAAMTEVRPENEHISAERRYQLQGLAGQFLRRAKALAPYHTDIRNALGNIYLQEGRVEDAIREYRASLDLHRRNPNAAANLCQAYAHRNPPDYDLAAYYLRMAMDVGFDPPPGYTEWIFGARRDALRERFGFEATADGVSTPTLGRAAPPSSDGG